MPRPAELRAATRASRWVALALAAATSLAAGLASATSPEPLPVPPHGGLVEPPAQQRSELSGVSAEVGSIFDTGGSTFGGGYVELLARIRNNDTQPVKGEVRLQSIGYGRNQSVVAPFTVAAGAVATIHIPADLRDTIRAEVVSENGRMITSRELVGGYDAAVRITDLYDPPRTRAVIDGLPLTTDFQPSAYGGRWGGGEVRLKVASASIDPATGAPVLPRHGIGYASTQLVLAPSELLTRLDGAELEALASFVLAGGTLAIGVSKPEDLRHPTLAAMLGGEAEAAPISELGRTVLPWPHRPGATAPYGARNPPPPSPPREELRLSGHRGGNLAPSHFGASATYGLGEVVLLSFDPSKPAHLEDPFVQVRLGELARRAFDRQALVIAPLGRSAEPNYGYYAGPFGSFDPYDGVRKQLDPNRTARWGIGIATILICLYAVLAGPVLFSAAKKRNRPLAALRWLPVASFGTFLLVVLIGVFAKGLGRRVHHLAIVDAGAGMPRAVVRRYRGFFGPDADTLSVRTTELTSAIAIAAELDRPTRFEVDREGVRLVGLETMPAETVVVREDGLASIGDGITLLEEPGDVVTIKNRTGRALRGLVLRTPGGRFFRAESLGDGERLSSGDMKSGGSDFLDWQRGIVSRSAGAVTVRDLSPGMIVEAFDELGERELGEAWRAIGQSAGEDVDWWPERVPVLLAQIDGGEGKTVDGGVEVQRARLLVRVTGWGGAP